MGWSIGYDNNWQRDIGYGVPSICDHPGCGKKIDRGLGYVCGGEPYGGDDGCGLYFCGKHGGGMRCMRCAESMLPFEKTPDTPEWIKHKLTDESWADWRKENPEWVAAHLKQRPQSLGAHAYLGSEEPGRLAPVILNANPDTGQPGQAAVSKWQCDAQKGSV